MPYSVIISRCGCAGVLRVFEKLIIIDSNKLVGTFEVLNLIINGETYEINTIFMGENPKGNFIDYLNETFRIIYGLGGNFNDDGEFIYYENIEGFETIEVVAILLTEYKTVTVSGDSYTDPDLVGKELDPRMFLDNQPVQLGYNITGYPVSFNDMTGTISNIYPGELSLSFRNQLPA